MLTLGPSQQSKNDQVVNCCSGLGYTTQVTNITQFHKIQGAKDGSQVSGARRLSIEFRTAGLCACARCLNRCVRVVTPHRHASPTHPVALKLRPSRTRRGSRHGSLLLRGRFKREATGEQCRCENQHSKHSNHDGICSISKRPPPGAQNSNIGFEN